MPSGVKRGEDNRAFDDIGSESMIKLASEDLEHDAVKGAKNGNKVYMEPMKDEDHDELEIPGNAFSRKVCQVQKYIDNTFQSIGENLWRLFYLVLLGLYLAYFCYAMYYRFGDEGSVRLLVVTVLVVFGFVWSAIDKLYGEKIGALWKSCSANKMSKETRSKVKRWTVIVFCLLCIVGVIIFLVIEVAMKDAYNLVSFAGLVIYVLMCFVFSFSPAHVRWQPVLGGLLLQFIFALLILRTWIGYQSFKWLGDRVSEFLQHTDAGSKFVFGSLWNQCFAFGVLPVIIFFSTVISVAYYLGFMQVLILKVAYVMQVLMGTTAAESVNAAANIFVGQSEAPLIIRPLLKNMTRSELHAVMTGGFATIAGAVLAAYISFGVPANHLLGASVMSAPAALAMAKLLYPETQKSKTTADNVKNLMESSPERNIFEAASNGASSSVKLVANIAVNLIAFLAILHFVDATLSWFGDRVGVDNLTFGLICSYLFFPLAWLMGVQPVDCRKVAELLGVKTFLNEFIAYEKLGAMVKNKIAFTQHIAANGTYTISATGDYLLTGRNVTLVGGFMQERSEVIATYALCGFANFGSMGIVLAALGVMAPNRKPELSAIVLRAMIAGNIACFMTACIAGLLFEPSLT